MKIRDKDLEWIKSLLKRNIGVLIIVLIVAYLLKYYYSVAGVGELKIFIIPVKFIVENVVGIRFIYDPYYGYISFESGIGIEKGCIGINYMIAIFLMLSFMLFPSFITQREKLMLIGLIIVISYLWMIIVNSVRISSGIILHRAEFHILGLSGDQIHRIQGILIYYIGMWVIYLIMINIGKVFFKKYLIDEREIDGIVIKNKLFKETLIYIPFYFYIAVVVVMPLLNGALFVNASLFINHTFWILLISTLITICISLFIRR